MRLRLSLPLLLLLLASLGPQPTSAQKQSKCSDAIDKEFSKISQEEKRYFVVQHQKNTSGLAGFKVLRKLSVNTSFALTAANGKLESVLINNILLNLDGDFSSKNLTIASVCTRSAKTYDANGEEVNTKKYSYLLRKYKCHSPATWSPNIEMLALPNMKSRGCSAEELIVFGIPQPYVNGTELKSIQVHCKNKASIGEDIASFFFGASIVNVLIIVSIRIVKISHRFQRPR